MRRSGSVACLAVYARLLRNDRSRPGKLERTGRVTLKAAQDGGVGGESLIGNASVRPVSRRERQSARFLIPGEAMLDVCVFIRLRNVSHGLRAGAERPASVWIARERACVM